MGGPVASQPKLFSDDRPRVWSMRAGAPKPPEGAIYVGRPSPWGNPFKLPEKCDAAKRDAVIAQYEEWLLSQPVLVLQVKQALAGKHLVCWCVPRRCHADVLLRIANEEEGV